MARNIVLGFLMLFAFQAGDFEKQYTEARAAFAVELVDFADWCKESKLFASGDAAYREVLEFDPENAEARKALGHKKQRDGSWKEPKARSTKDHGKSALAERDATRARINSEYNARCIELLEAHSGDLPARRRQEIVAELLEATPDDPRVRALMGESRDGEEWVLAETVRAKAQRKELKDMVRKAYAASSEPKKITPNEREAAFPIQWKLSVDAGVARVHGTGRKEEVQALGRVLQVAREYFRSGFNEPEVDYYPGATVFLLAKPGEKESFLESHPKIDDTYREFMMKLEGSGVQLTSDLAHWGQDERARIDGATRIALGWLFRGAFTITSDHAWVFEGFGLYMTRELVGTRLTWFARPSEYLPPEQDSKFRTLLMNPKTNWMDEAHKMLSSDRSPRLVFVMGKDINNLTPEDLLFSYVTAAYLLEGWPDKAPELLRRVGSGTVAATAVEEVLGFDVNELDKRVRRWLTERK